MPCKFMFDFLQDDFAHENISFFSFNTLLINQITIPIYSVLMSFVPLIGNFCIPLY